MFDVYISSSWKNKFEVRSFANQIKEKTNLSVFDFTDRTCRTTQPIPPGMTDPFDSNIISYKTYLNTYKQYKLAVNENKKIISECKYIFLLLPCGIDATADWAYGVGCGKPSLIIGHPNNGDFSPTHMWANDIVENTNKAIDWLLDEHIKEKQSDRI